MALSSCEPEFIATTTAAMQALWLRSLLSELTTTKERMVTLFVDNNSAIALMKIPVITVVVNTQVQSIILSENALRGGRSLLRDYALGSRKPIHS